MPSSPTARVSLCMIARDEEACLADCLRSVADLVWEMIVVDTGSKDQTKEIARSLGAQVFEFAWVDNFAAARNESLRHANGDWIFWLDADERLDEDHRRRLQSLFAGLRDENVAYTMRQRSRLEASTHSTAMVDHVRLFRNHPLIRWQYRVHEQILPSIRQVGGDLRNTDIVIDHIGFQDPALQGPKVERNFRLLQLELTERPNDPFVLFNLAGVYMGKGRYVEALPLLRRSLELSQPGDTIVRKLYALMARAHHHAGQPGEALTACRSGRKIFPDDPELLFWEAMILREQKDLNGAIQCVFQLQQLPRSSHFTGVDEGMQSYKASQLLGEIFREKGEFAKAEEKWRKVLQEHPHFVPARMQLAELLAAQNRWQELEQVGAQLQDHLYLDPNMAVMLARGKLALGKFSESRKILEETISRNPTSLVPRILLSHVLLQEGRDWNAAEQALREVLRMDPKQEESWRNLVSLLRQERRLAEAFAACEAGKTYCPNSDELSLLEATILHQRGDRRGAAACLVGILKRSSEEPERKKILATLRQSARHLLAIIYREEGRHKDAELQWQALVTEWPNFSPAWLELGELFLLQNRWTELEQVAQNLRTDAQQVTEADLFRARAHLAQRKFEPSREILQKIIAADPDALKPRIALSYSYLQEGLDWDAAERSLREVLAMAPNHSEARHNLALVLEKKTQRQKGNLA